MKRFKDLTFANDFIFSKVMRNPEICKRVLELILEISIEKVEYVEYQKTIDILQHSKSVRMDVYVKDCFGTVFNVEMQSTDTGNLPKRARYYQCCIDADTLEKGQNFRRLPQSYIIFICPDDIFKKGAPVYTFRNACVQENGSIIPLNDGSAKIFVNPNAFYCAKQGLKNLLQYIGTGMVCDEFTKQLDNAVKTAKSNKGWEVEYMKYEANIIDAREDGLREGLREGLDEGLKALVQTLKPLMPSFQELCAAIRQNSQYANVSDEEIKKYY